MSYLVTFLGLFATIYTTTTFADPDMLQDLCVADLSTGAAKVNGYVCKEMTKVNADDFFFAGISQPGKPNNTVGSIITGANVQKIPGLNTQGVSFSRIDYAPHGLNPPHIHPRASEVVFVLDGQLEVGFITTANVLISKKINEGEVFVFPRGLVHYQMNLGSKAASVLAAFNSQLPGTQSITGALFTGSPEIPTDVLTKTFQIGDKEVNKIKNKLAPTKKV